MNTRLTPHQRTEALAYRIYLQENKPSDSAADHWLRAESALSNLDGPTKVSSSGAATSEHLEAATLQCLGVPGIRGLALIYRKRPEDGGKFYPNTLQVTRLPLELPATLHLDETSETFNLVRLQFATDGDSFDIAFQE